MMEPASNMTKSTATTPPEGIAVLDDRVRDAWKSWLCSLATDADAATAAAHMYAEMSGEARDALIDALAEDAPTLEVPGVAVFGPLLAVEAEPKRRARLQAGAGMSLGPMTSVKRALLATGRAGERVAVLVIPLYLDFVRVLVCRFVKDRGFEWVKQDPIVISGHAPDEGLEIDGMTLYTSSHEAVVDELAHAVLAHRRSGRPPPQLLQDCADLFSARLADA